MTRPLPLLLAACTPNYTSDSAAPDGGTDGCTCDCGCGSTSGDGADGSAGGGGDATTETIRCTGSESYSERIGPELQPGDALPQLTRWAHYDPEYLDWYHDRTDVRLDAWWVGSAAGSIDGNGYLTVDCTYIEDHPSYSGYTGFIHDEFIVTW